MSEYLPKRHYFPIFSCSRLLFSFCPLLCLYQRSCSLSPKSSFRRKKEILRWCKCCSHISHAKFWSISYLLQFVGPLTLALKQVLLSHPGNFWCANLSICSTSKYMNHTVPPLAITFQVGVAVFWQRNLSFLFTVKERSWKWWSLTPPPSTTYPYFLGIENGGLGSWTQNTSTILRKKRIIFTPNMS